MAAALKSAGPDLFLWKEQADALARAEAAETVRLAALRSYRLAPQGLRTERLERLRRVTAEAVAAQVALERVTS